jgi:sucrose phosphorylase
MPSSPKDSPRTGRGRVTRIGYHQDPDFTKPLFEIPAEAKERMFRRLAFLYGEAEAVKWMPELMRILKVHYAHKPQALIDMEKGLDPRERFTEKDMILITYGDIVYHEGESNFATLHRFVERYNRGAINTLHLLPFFPYSSDRGFAVVDFRAVHREIGTWDDIRGMGVDYDLMFDAVLNHCSSRSRMFREYLRGNPNYKDFFVAYDSPDDLTLDQRSKIFRPRTSDILTKFYTVDGPRYIWTTFSEDQVDLNFRNPAVLMQVLESLLFYIRRGADILRLDAVTYIWAEPGTECIHLPETHEIVKLIRDVLNTVASSVAIITETNVPHEDNVSYFGNGYDEAHMVYNFALPPLVLHTFYTEDATAISKWAADLKVDSDTATFFNMLDTHDGIGLMGVKGILSKEEIELIIKRAKEHGAYISYKMTEARTEEPYEINCTWWSAINYDDGKEDMSFQVKRYIASRSISLVIQGVAAVYVHGGIGTPNNHELVEQTKHRRDVNRGSIHVDPKVEALEDPTSKLSLLRAYASTVNLIRTSQRAFHPQGEQRVLMISPDVFTVLRISPEGDQHVLAMTNVTNRESSIDIPLSDLGVAETGWHDLVGDTACTAKDGKLSITLLPYDIIWLKPLSELQKTNT